MNRLESRSEIYSFITIFYQRIRSDELLGPIFNRRINDWEHHLEHITDFWESNILSERSYQGNPVFVHQKVDEKEAGNISQEHFGIWLQLWFATLDEYCEGENVSLMKERARNMAHHLYMRIFSNRKTNKKAL